MRTDLFRKNAACARRRASTVWPIILTLAVAALLPAARGQGTVVFNHRGTGTIVARVYGPGTGFDAYEQRFGNTAADTPAGTQVYTGALLSGSGWTAQLWAAPGADRPESELLAAVPTTTFRTGAAAGYVAAAIAILTGVPQDCPVATVQMRVWPSIYPTWEAVQVAWLTGTLGTNTFGQSQTFNVTNIGGNVNSSPNLLGLRSFSLSISSLEPPMLPPIVQQPENQTVVVGQDVTFSVTVGEDYVPDWYQWRFSGSNIPGATASSLTLTNVQLDQAGEYAVVVTNYYGQSVSSNAILTVISSTAPTITSQPQDQTVTIGQPLLPRSARALRFLHCRVLDSATSRPAI